MSLENKGRLKFQGPQPDRWSEVRKRTALPEIYEDGMNCIMDIIENPEFRSLVYQKIHQNPEAFRIVLSGRSALFVVNSRAFLDAYNSTVDKVRKMAEPAKDKGCLQREIGESEADFGERLTLKSISLMNEAISLLKVGKLQGSEQKSAEAMEIGELLDLMKISPVLKFGKGGKFLGFDRKKRK